MNRAIAMALSLGVQTLGFPDASVAQGRSPVSAAAVRFEVTSVKAHRAADDVMFAHEYGEGGRFTATGTLRMLIRTAYRLQEFQVLGPRGWIDDERFDIEGRAGGDATPDEMRVMLRALLSERFGLVLRSERRDAPVYALRVAKAKRGERLRPTAEACAAGACDIRLAPGLLSARGVTMAALASELSWWVDRMVTDHTARTGKYDLDLEWAPAVLPPAPAPISTLVSPVGQRRDRDAPSIFTAVREQLGLTLQPERGAVDVFVIERAERPAAN